MLVADTALYLAHLNPVTRSHVEIISELQKDAKRVKVMPVVFKEKDGTEVNSKSFPFSFKVRREMLESVFGDTIDITDDYTFVAPFKRYMPPLISPRSWKLRKQILKDVKGDFFSYTGDKTEGYMLKVYMLKPRVGKRKTVSATSVKDEIYREANMDHTNEGTHTWEEYVPASVAKIVRKEWDTVKMFAGVQDMTIRIAGMKFPKERDAR